MACARSGATVMSILACASVSCLAMSLAVNSALMVVAVAPARRMPWNATANAELLGDNNATTSPTPMPRSASAPGERVDANDQVAVGDFRAGLRVDERDPVGVGLAEVAEQVVVDADVGDLDVGEGAGEAHRISLIQLFDQFLRCDQPVGGVDEFADLVPVDLAAA